MTDKRIENISKLDASRAAGDAAAVNLRQLEPIIRQTQDRYYRELVAKTKQAGEVDNSTVYKMVALQELLEEMRTTIARGGRAAVKLDELLTGGSDDG